MGWAVSWVAFLLMARAGFLSLVDFPWMSLVWLCAL